ncbi:hypothetical protein bmyco0003_21170 [Bacillus pseudomycoides]|nr:hypothetical protein bmyco0003_21170 [Bacillus pseudomycoides]
MLASSFANLLALFYISSIIFFSPFLPLLYCQPVKNYEKHI